MFSPLQFIFVSKWNTLSWTRMFPNQVFFYFHVFKKKLAFKLACSFSNSVLPLKLGIWIAWTNASCVVHNIFQLFLQNVVQRYSVQYCNSLMIVFLRQVFFFLHCRWKLIIIFPKKARAVTCELGLRNDSKMDRWKQKIPKCFWDINCLF